MSVFDPARSASDPDAAQARTAESAPPHVGSPGSAPPDPYPLLPTGGRVRGLAELVDGAWFRLEQWRARPGPTMAAFGLVTAVAFGLWWFGRPEPVRPAEDLMPLVSVMSTGSQGVGGGVGEDSEGEMAEATTATSSDAAGVVVVHVAGAVEAPGIYELPAGQRVAEAIAAAGGASDGADLDRLNLAAPIRDGSQVRVPTRDESDATATVTTIGPVGGGADQGDIDAAVDLNRAGSQALESLPGIGPATAAAIVDWREANGGFRTVDELLAVPGIGPAKFAVLADLVSVG